MAQAASLAAAGLLTAAGAAAGPAQPLSAVDGGGSAGLRGGAVYKTAEIGLCFP
ncbi:MAG: hypothetical protein ACLR5H_14505 [Oscillospiraceae bacterium]